MNREIEREALFYPGVSLEFKSAHDDSHQQIKDIETLVNDGGDLLGVAPNEVSAITPELMTALAGLSDHIKIIPLSDDEAGTCIIEVPDEIIDASASTQLKNIRDLIHEI